MDHSAAVPAYDALDTSPIIPNPSSLDRMKASNRADCGLASDYPETLMANPAFLLNTVAVTVAQLMENALEPIGLRVRHFRLLLLLDVDRPYQQSALGPALGIDRTTVVALVDFLEQRELAKRLREPDDRRAYLVRLTPKGAALTRHATEVANRIEERMFGPLAPTERETLIVLVMRLLVRPGPIADIVRASRREAD